MLNVALDFDNNLTKDALVISRAYVSAIGQNELDTMKQKSPNNTFTNDDPPIFQIQVTNRQFAKPLATPTFKFDIGDNTVAEDFVVKKKRTGPIIGLHFMRKSSAVIDTTHGLIHFAHLSMQNKASSEMSAQTLVILTDDALTIPPGRTYTITTSVDHPSECKTTGTVTPLEKVHGNSQSADFSLNVDNKWEEEKKVAVRVNNTMETPYLIIRNTQITEFSVVTPEQARFVRPLDTAILSLIPGGDSYLTGYLSELLRKNKPE